MGIAICPGNGTGPIAKMKSRVLAGNALVQAYMCIHTHALALAYVPTFPSSQEGQ